MNIDEFLSLPVHAGRKSRVRTRKRGPYRQRPDRTPDELIEFLKTNGIRSVRHLRKTRKDGDPIPHDFVRAFGSWRVAMNAAAIPDPFSVAGKRPDPNCIIRAIVEMNLWRRDDYQAAHLRLPDAIPSVHWAYALFAGSWRKARMAAERLCIRVSTERWMTLRRRLGHSPTLAEVDRHGIALDPLIRIYGSRKEAANFLRDLARFIDERERLSAGNAPDISRGNQGPAAPQNSQSNGAYGVACPAP